MTWISRNRIQTALGLLFAFHIVTQAIAIYTENINWDEFALLARAADSLRAGELHTGGRPGFAVLTLMPFVHDCANGVLAVRAARWLWLIFTIALAAGFWVLLRGVLGMERPWTEPALGVALLVFVPEFLRYSLQVRTDQPAAAFALWGSVALLFSARRLGWAVLAGLAFGAGYLFSQKAVYVVALGALLVAGHHYISSDFNLKREGLRIAVCLAGAVVIVFGYDLVVGLFLAPGSAISFAGGMRSFAFYRAAMGYSYYAQMAPALIPHFALLVLVAVLSLAAIRHGRLPERPLVVAAAVAALGFAVAAFHAGAFPYFWMTLGLFPAAAAALGLDAIGRRYGSAHRPIVIGSIWVFLIVVSVTKSGILLKDTQSVQLSTIQYVNDAFTAEQEGFQAERALFCRDGEEPLPTFFTQSIYFRFSGEDGREQMEQFVDEFRSRPVAFLINTFRLRRFPPDIQHFWREHYTWDSSAVLVPNRPIRGQSGEQIAIDIFVPGEYRFSGGARERSALAIAGRELDSGSTIWLSIGDHRGELLQDVEDGRLTFVLPAEPPELVKPFYKRF